MTKLEQVRAFLASKGHGTADSHPVIHSYEDAIMADEMMVKGADAPPITAHPREYELFAAQKADRLAAMSVFASDALAQVAAENAAAERDSSALIVTSKGRRK